MLITGAKKRSRPWNEKPKTIEEERGTTQYCQNKRLIKVEVWVDQPL